MISPIVIEKEISPLEKHIYTFSNVDQLVFIFNSFTILTRTSVNDVFEQTRDSKNWDRTYPSYSNIPEPELTLGIRAEVIDAAIDKIKVQTWKEFK